MARQLWEQKRGIWNFLAMVLSGFELFLANSLQAIGTHGETDNVLLFIAAAIFRGMKFHDNVTNHPIRKISRT